MVARVDSVLRMGDLNGLGKIYSEGGGLISEPGERILRVAEGWDIDVISPWRRILPKTLFSGFGGRAASRLYLTTYRVVLIREVDVWREVKGELTPLGLPAAAAKEFHLKELKSAGARQFCEVRPRQFRTVKKKRIDRRRSWLDLRLLGVDGVQYSITIWKTDGVDPDTLGLIDSQFAV